MTKQKIQACVTAIIAWNKAKTWTNYQNLRRDCYLKLNSYNPILWAIYTHIKTIWNILTGKYARCEETLRNDKGLQAHYGVEV